MARPREQAVEFENCLGRPSDASGLRNLPAPQHIVGDKESPFPNCGLP